MQFRVPTTVKHEDFLAAIKPLLDLLGVTADEIHNEVHISGAGRDSKAFTRISMSVVARHTDDDNQRPDGTAPFEALQEYGELSQLVVVEVI